ncbi:Pentatricopeptide repeat [Parasponia andersonii]|uniref:Pentatricopeptide repeat n=1 Tax=Parasponia andersonii TaxID=3476 RepID=A0A2P5CR69_PARAD|nr:Pentatricopeptide repeat [Parasponia andersonii]
MPSIRAFNHLLEALSKKKHSSIIVSMYKRMMIGCLYFRPNVCTLNAVIKCLCRSEKVKLGFSVLATLYKHGLRPNAYTLTTLLHGLCTQASMAGETGKALELLKKLHDNRRIKPFVGCFKPIVDMDEALSLFQDMINLGVVLDVVTYTSSVHGLCKFGCWEHAKRFLIDMLDRGISPDVCTYSAVFDSFVKMGKF